MRARRPGLGDEGGSAVALLAVLAASVALAVGVVVAGGSLVERQRIVDAADASALAAADAASGAISGVPCERAAETARGGGATVSACEVDDRGIARVEVSARILGTAFSASARAGPP